MFQLMEKVKQEIAGEISLSDDAGATMKKWREIFGITQVELSKHLGITVSTISDMVGCLSKVNPFFSSRISIKLLSPAFER